MRRFSRYSTFALDKKVSRRVEVLIRYHRPRTILFYLPLAIEADLRPLMHRARKKYKIFVPFVQKESFKMVKYRLPLKKNAFDIQEPLPGRLKINEVDMAIVPVVGVDGACKRVGFGKGMYDRFFQTLKKRPVVVFVQRVACTTREIVTDGYDIAADYYITPAKSFINRGRNDDNNRTRSGTGRRRRRCRRCRADCKTRA